MAETEGRSVMRRIADGWVNVISELGTDADKRTGFRFRRGRIDRTALSRRFVTDALTSRIAELPAREMTRKWVRLDVSDDPDAISEMTQEWRRLGVRSKFQEAITWSRLHGGAGIIMFARDDESDMSTPLNVDSLQEIESLKVVDGDDLKAWKYYQDPDDPEKFDTPELYTLNTVSRSSKVIHETRVLIFDGDPIPNRERRERDGWGASAVERSEQPLEDYLQGAHGIAHALTDFAQAVLKIKGLANMLKHGEDVLVRKRIQMMDRLRSVMKLVPVDADLEDFSRVPTPMAGVPEALDRLAELLSASTEIPIALLLGRSVGGLSDSDSAVIRGFYDSIASKQERLVVPQLTELTHLLFIASDGPTGGEEPDSWLIETVPLWQLDEKEEAEVRKLTAETDRSYLEDGVLHADEVRTSRFGGESYSVETVIDTSLDAALTAADADS